MSKVIKRIVIQKLRKTLPRHSLAIFKSFVRPHLDYGDIIYDQPSNEGFTQKIERIQYNAALAITRTIKGTSHSKLYSELGFGCLKFRLWFRKLCTENKCSTRMLVLSYSTNESFVQYSCLGRCYNILKQN